MNKKIIKIYVILIAVCAFLFIGKSTTYAASASISASSTEVSVGSKVTIKVNGTGRAWSLKVSGSGISDTIVGGNLSSKENQNFSESYTLNTSSAGTYKVSLTGDVTDSSGTKEISDSVTVKVSEKSTSRGNTVDNTNNTKNEEKAPNFKSANETVYATGNINVRKSYTADSEKIGSLSTGEKVTRTGIGDNGWSKVSYNGSVGYIKSTLLTTEEPKKSVDKALKSLTIEGVELSPEFDPETTDYSASVDSTVDKIEVKAEVNDEKSKKEITGNEELKDGENIVKITVTAEDGTTRIYTINVTKKTEKAIGLSSLEIKGHTLSPNFSHDVKEYKIAILDQNVTSLDISAVADNENAKVETTGNSNLKNGDNVILVKVTSEDGTQTTTYKITATKNSTAVANKENTDNIVLYAGIGIIVILVIAIIAVIVISKKKSQYEDDDEFSGDDNESTCDYSDLYGDSEKQDVSDFNKFDSFGSYSNENKKEQDSGESIYGDFSAKANSQRIEDESNKYESNYSGEKDVNYYNNKISELFDAQESDIDMEEKSQNSFDYTSDNSYTKENNDYEYGDDEYKPRKSKGKHSK